MIAIHAMSGIVALATGLFVVLIAKGTRRHRLAGRSYTASMALLIASSFGIYLITGAITVFYAVSFLEVALLAAGLAMPAYLRERRSDWQAWHLRLMLTSYLVLVVTFVAQFFDALPLPSDALNAIAFIQIPVIVGLVLIARAGRQLPDAHGDPGRA